MYHNLYRALLRRGAMTEIAVLSQARWASLATGSGGLPSAAEWPLVAAASLAFAVLAALFLRCVGLSWRESSAFSVLTPALLLVNVPLAVGESGVKLLANVTGCVLPVVAGVWIVATRRAHVVSVVLLLAVGIGLAFVSSRVVPSRGVLLNYQNCALGIGLFAALLFRASPALAGAMAFASAAIGTTVGADLLHLSSLMTLPNTATITLGGAGLLDGILLTAIASSGVAAASAGVAYAITNWRTYVAFVRLRLASAPQEKEGASMGTR